MDQLTSDLLTKWGFFEYIDAFSVARIDSVALTYLTLQDLQSVMPAVGDRVKLMANINLWKQDQGAEGITRETPPNNYPEASTSWTRPDYLGNREPLSPLMLLDNILCDTIGDTAQPSTSSKEKEEIENILKATLHGRSLLSGDLTTKKLTDADRRLIVRYVLDSHFNKAPNQHIKWEQFQAWAEGIAQLFPLESPALYYTPSIAAHYYRPRRTASGYLYQTYHRIRRDLLSRRIIEPLRRRCSGSAESVHSSDSEGGVSESRPCPIDLSVTDTEEDFKEALQSLELAIEGAVPWAEIEDLWSATVKARLRTLYGASASSINYYFNRFPVLKGPNGYRLLSLDFQQLFPGKGENDLRSGLSRALKSLLERVKIRLPTSRDVHLKRVTTEIVNAIEESEHDETKLNGALLLLPLTLNVAPSKKVKKSSKLEVAKHFILRLPTEAEVQPAIEDYKRQLVTRNLTFQPIVVLVCESLNRIVKAFVVIDDITYEFANLIPAVDLAFKLFHATAAEYPAVSHDVWLFIQKGFYDITTKYDSSSSVVRSMLVDIGLKEKC